MRIAVIGNCTVDTLAACLGVLLDAEVEAFWAQPSRTAEAETFARRLGDFDVVCTHPQRSGPFGPPRLAGSAKRVITLPVLNFSGFHPDDVMIPAVRGPLGFNHSAIVIASFLMGLPPRRAAKLFNPLVYASLGYFDRYDEEHRRLVEHGAERGFDLAAGLAVWPKPFLYDIQHPCFEPLAWLAGQIAVRIGGPLRAVDLADPAVRAKVDHTRYNATWPVYPQIAARLGLEPPGPPVFRFERRERAEPEAAVALNLGRFIQRSYAVYRGADPEVLRRAVEPELAVLSGLVVPSAAPVAAA